MKNSGIVLRIEKTSIHDGDGLRTVVFLKGCPLRCKWCSTPESQPMAIEQGYGREMTVREVMKEICKDEIFFFHSGGGVTISGGEVLAQADFAEAILRVCRDEGIPAAIETSLFANFETIRPLLPLLDDMYIDFKVADDALHHEYTGVSNQQIRENLQRVDAAYGGRIHIRIPTIPGVNMTEENMRQTAEFLRALHRVTDVELLPYHRLGLETYRKLGRTYELPDIATPPMEEMRRMAEVIQGVLPDRVIKIKGEPV